MKAPENYLSDLVDHYDKLKYALLKVQTFSEEHYGFPSGYYKIMETDNTRVNAFKKAFEKYDFTDKTVCEAGIGTMALTHHFMPKIKKAYLIENNPELREVIYKKLKKNNWENKVELIFGDAMKTELPEKVDYIIGEMMSIYCGNEYQVQVFKHLRQFLKPGGKLLPERIINIAQLARADFDDTHKHYPINFSRHLPELLSLQSVVNRIDLYTENKLSINQSTPITPILSGEVNAIYMRSFVQVANDCNFTGTDSLMPPTVCKLEKPVYINHGKTVHLKCHYTYGTSLDEAKFWIEK